MPICVVDGFKGVKVQHDNGAGFPFLHVLQGFRSQSFEMGKFAQLSQGVVGVFILHLLLFKDIFADVGDNAKVLFRGFRHVDADIPGVADLENALFPLQRVFHFFPYVAVKEYRIAVKPFRHLVRQAQQLL